jgi:hypothetical protein
MHCIFNRTIQPFDAESPLERVRRQQTSLVLPKRVCHWFCLKNSLGALPQLQLLEQFLDLERRTNFSGTW